MNRRNISAALIVAVFVGTILNVINSYEVFAKAKFTSTNIARIILTYIIPFCVSLYSSVRAIRQNRKTENKF